VPSGLTVGLEEEVMVLDPDTLDLLPRAPELLSRLAGDPRVKLELPAAQLELVVGPAATVPEAIAELRRARDDLALALAGEAALGCAGVHPFADVEGPLNDGPRHAATQDEYAAAARRQLVAALQVHVAVRDGDRALAVYEGLRRHLPDIAALAANAPFQSGRDTGLASVRPLICRMLPRQGVPPPIRDWAELTRELSWGARAGGVTDPGRWWWELRPHLRHGTLEIRVPDAQTDVADASAVAAFVPCLCAELVGRHDAGERLEPVPTWRIEENRWSAARHGSAGTMADLRTGRPEPTADRLHALIDRLAAHAGPLGCVGELDHARRLVDEPGWRRQREAAEGGMTALVADLAARF
jgi:carboxylate-amine ligase